METQTLKSVYGIGNPLIDVIVHISSEDLSNLGIHKGTMQLITKEQRLELADFIKTRKAIYSCGGSCPNTVITLACLGIPTTLGGKIGDDEFGHIYRKQLELDMVKDELRTCSEPTGSSIILVTEDSERTMNTYLGANREYRPEDVVESSVKNASIFHFTGYMWDTENQKAAIRKALKIAHQANVKVSFDIADPFAVSRYREDFFHLIENECDIVYANNEEARILFDNYDAYECCKSMGKLCPVAIVKNGKRGSFISHHREIFPIEVSGPQTAVDTTGAGDTYAAGFLYGICKGYDIAKSGEIASYLAGEVIKQVGAQFSMEKIKEIISYLQSIT
ncbi:MAG: adenosine kinase [Sphaerochaetaceae bacterium]|jgi:sugar/nucleoside kinase (ribokinase family)|nr:adenosine kinase [Sphaerochaetaceae bacterium]NLY07704.1 adenosine kinase [Spirochaetales bacterium]